MLNYVPEASALEEGGSPPPLPRCVSRRLCVLGWEPTLPSKSLFQDALLSVSLVLPVRVCTHSVCKPLGSGAQLRGRPLGPHDLMAARRGGAHGPPHTLRRRRHVGRWRWACWPLGRRGAAPWGSRLRRPAWPWLCSRAPAPPPPGEGALAQASLRSARPHRPRRGAVLQFVPQWICSGLFFDAAFVGVVGSLHELDGFARRFGAEVLHKRAARAR